MSNEGRKIYPGGTATPEQIVALANEYRRAAEALLPNGRRRQPLSWAPYRLNAIHAVELYLNALLLSAGHPPEAVRGLQHDFSARTRLALEAKLSLKKGTIAHLQTLFEAREYLTARYDPTAPPTSELTRFSATLKEVGDKVALVVTPPPKPA